MDNRIFVFDLECACWMGRPPQGMRRDIIEIGFCILDLSVRTITDRVSLIIKPKNAEISLFCKKMTGISQKKANNGMSLKQACAILKEHGAGSMRSAAWGNFDHGALEMDCDHYGIPYPLSKVATDAQSLFREKKKLKYESSVAGALLALGRKFNGRQHSASDDAFNTAVVLSEILI